MLGHASAGVAKRLACAIAMAASIAVNIGTSHAQGLAGLSDLGVGASVPAGTATMLRLRVPLDSSTPQPTLGLSFGSYWREAPGSMGIAGYRFVASAEASFNFGGDLKLKLGSFHTLLYRASAEAEVEGEEQGYCARNLGGCLIIGILAAAGLAYWLADEKGYKQPCIDGSGCPT